jgi:transketolase
VTATLRSYADMLCEVGERHTRVVVVDAGLATSMQTYSFAEHFPARYFNLGIAEQNAVGVASGLARRGFVPIVHTFSNFLARRAHDQVALSVAWPGCNVKMIGGSCGIFDGRNGPSHFAADDLAAMSALPGLVVAEPGDQRQLRELLHFVVGHQGPAYLRLRRHGAPSDLLPGMAPATGTVVVQEAKDAVCTLVAGGSMLSEALLAARILTDRDVPLDLIHVSVLRPLDPAPIVISGCRTGLVIVVENHAPVGGFGDAVSRAIGPLGVRQVRLTLPDRPLPAGDPAWLLDVCGLDGRTLAERIKDLTEELAHV